MDEGRIDYVRTVKIGDIISHPDFENLLFKDIMTMDAMCGFYVNPRKHSSSAENIRFTTIESPGLIKRRTALTRPNMVSIKQTTTHDAEFVVIYTYRDTDSIPEVLWENEVIGRYPLMVIAKELTPEGEWDEFGIEITFRMESEIQKHVVPEVILKGFMSIKRERVF